MLRAFRQDRYDEVGRSFSRSLVQLPRSAPAYYIVLGMEG